MSETFPEDFVEAFQEQALALVDQKYQYKLLFIAFNLQNELSKGVSTVLKNIFGFLSEVGKLGEENAATNKKNDEEYRKALELTQNLIEYIDKIHVEIPSLVECNFKKACIQLHIN